MPTNASQAFALFLFAHQDDEFGVYGLLDAYQRAGNPVRCIYFTDGAVGGVDAATRNEESIQVLARLGVGRDSIIFAGELLSIDDGALPEHLAPAYQWLMEWLDKAGSVSNIYMPCWEGGHHDHDALHAIATQVAMARGLLEKSMQFALYNGASVRHPFFRILSPLEENGPVRTTKMRWPMRVRSLRYCLSYPSQRRTWIGLFPFALIYFITKGVQSLQAVDPARTRQRPHDGPLYYELRNFYSWEKMRMRLDAWRNTHDEA